jgi:hypothetical protein
MSGDVTPFQQYAFMAWKGTTFRLPLISVISAHGSESLRFSDNHCAFFVHFISSMSVRERSLPMLPRLLQPKVERQSAPSYRHRGSVQVIRPIGRVEVGL